ncbi:phosphatase PAP2 family protein [Aquimarina rhabdastrellae]
MKANYFLPVLFSVFFIALQTNAQHLDENASTWDMLKHDGVSVFGGVKHAYTRPFHWKKKDFIALGGVVAGTALLYTLDERADPIFQKQGDGVPHIIKEFGFRFGKPLFNYGLTTGIYSFGLLTKNEKVRRTGVLLIASATAGGILQTAVKTLAGRARPIAGLGNDTYDPFNSEANYHSFPSGHAILAMTTAHAIAKQFDNIYIKSGIYAIGLVTPISRLWAGAHWLTDVALGVAIGIVVVESIDRYLTVSERYAYTPKKNKIKWDLKLGAGQLGIVGRF